jgi:general secretion pathway protein G
MRAVRNQTNNRRRDGFSLLELLIVLAIIGLIAAMVLPNLIGQQQKANIGITKEAIHNMEQALKLYAVDHNAQYPKEPGRVDFADPADRHARQAAAGLHRKDSDRRLGRGAELRV